MSDPPEIIELADTVTGMTKIDLVCSLCWMADFGGHRFGGRESVQEFMHRVACVWEETQLWLLVRT